MTNAVDDDDDDGDAADRSLEQKRRQQQGSAAEGVLEPLLGAEDLQAEHIKV